ncbi:MAG: PAS domain-containing protein [Thermoleophilia bacterium]|jgi:aerotaxis receptor|nr:PAS domain-containing protein [Thermoleophilia bacterium]
MSHSRPTPVLRERPFAPGELFFSTTDRRGVIQSGNSVFSRVAAHPVDELVGRPHNLIRHPDMPRVVFRTLWAFLEAGRPIAAYVKNMARTGEYYWVVATVVPIEEGYLSVRFKPTTELLGTVEAAYRELRGIEARVEEEGRSRRAGMEASAARLAELLAALGHDDYESFMSAFLPAEIASHEAAIAAGEPAARPDGGHDERSRALVDVRASAEVVRVYLDGLLGNLDAYLDLNRRLAGKSRFVLDLADGVRGFALNALIAASRLNGSGATLESVAGLMRARSDDTARLIRVLSTDIDEAVGLLRDLAFRICAAKLQAEMAVHFVDELLVGAEGMVGSGSRGVREDLHTLCHCLDEGLGRVTDSLSGIDARLTRIAAQVQHLSRGLEVLGILQVNGRIEAARLGDAGAFEVLFGQVRDQLERARTEMADFAAVAAAAGRRGSAAEEAGLRRNLADMRERAEVATAA